MSVEVTKTINSSLLLPGKSYAIRIRAVNNFNVAGGWSEFINITTGTDSGIPATPTGIILTPAIRGIIIQWNANTESDFDHYEIHISPTNGFTPNSSTLVSQMGPGTIEYISQVWTGVAWAQVTPATTYYIRMAAIDRSGNRSPFSAQLSATTGQATSNDIVGLVADKITAGTLTAAYTLSGTIRTATSGARVVIDSSGIKGYANDGVTTTLNYNTGTGTLTISGTLTGANAVVSGSISGNYSAGTSGWAINSDGTAEFNNGTFRGDLVVGNSQGSTLISRGNISTTINGASAVNDVIIQSLSTYMRLRSQQESVAGSYFDNISTVFGASDQIWLAFSRHSTTFPSATTDKLISNTNFYGALLAHCGTWALNGAYARFGHTDFINSNNYGMVQANDGITHLSGVSTRLKTGNNDRLHVDTNGIFADSTYWMQDNPIRLRGFGDNNHSLFFNGGINGPELNGFDAVRISIVNTSKSFDFNNNGVATAPSGGGWTVASSLRFKEQVSDSDHDINTIKAMRPVSFGYKDTRAAGRQYGFIAEEMAEVFPEAVAFDKQDRPDSIDYGKLTVPLVSVVKQLIERVEELEERLNGSERRD